jgi:SAM-dependent methyltransferase
MTSLEQGFQDFAEFAAKLKGDEKSEAQTFLFHLLEAFHHDPNTLPAGSTFEYRVRFPGQKTKYADFVWPARVLIEMKSRGAKLSQHYQQTFDYWINLVPHRPPYVVLCNFDEFWIYDFNTQLSEPVDRVHLADLPKRHDCLKFLFPVYSGKTPPVFGNNLVQVTDKAARHLADVFQALVKRNEPRARAQRFILQCVVASFAEDIGLLPSGLFTGLVDECRRGDSSYDRLGGLFRQMNDRQTARAGRYAGVDYFNGGLFATVEPIELQSAELDDLLGAVKHDWSKVQPVIFGSLFEGSMDDTERHAFGQHFTYESDIQKVVRATIVRPWERRIAAAKTVPELLQLLQQLRRFRVLDPACGSGNFLYVAYRALRELERQLLLRIFRADKRQFAKLGTASGISPKQFFGLDIKDFAVELAKVTLMLARRLATRDDEQFWQEHQDELGVDTAALEFEKDLPLDNLDDNIICADALSKPWPEADAIIGNPPYLGSRYLAKEHGYEYARKVYAAFPDVPKMADFCVYWFRLAHDRLPPGGRAGLVGTKTIRQNESREASLDYIVNNGGTITEAVAHQVWSGEAAVHVSIVNWVKGEEPGVKNLFAQLGDSHDSPWKREEVEYIGPTLTNKTDVTKAQVLVANETAKKCFTGQNPVNAGFFLTPDEARAMFEASPKNREVLFPYMIGRDLLEHGGPTRWIIDFAQRDLLSAMNYEIPFERVKEKVMPVVMERAEREKKAKGEDVTRYTRIAQRWWQFYDYRPGTIAAINSVPRYIACSRTTKRSIFEFVSNSIHADSKLVIFSLVDDYSFGILQSGIHWEWVVAKGSTLKGDQNYTSDTVFDTFPWPQFEVGSDRRADRSPDGALGESALPPAAIAQITAVAEAARALRQLRREIMAQNGWSLRDLYRTLELPGTNRLRDAQAALDTAVRRAYGMPATADILAFLLKLNLDLAAKEAQGHPITAPGLPKDFPDPQSLVTADCIEP